MRTKVTCELCPKACEIAPGESGECRIRVNINGQLRAVTYGFPVTAHVDPVEKKPFFHYHPGQPILSFATARVQPALPGLPELGDQPGQPGGNRRILCAAGKNWWM